MEPMKDPLDDTAFAARALAALPDEAPPAVLEARILADFDALARRRRRSFGAALRRLARQFADLAWPGVPAWQPASVFALSLLIGLAAGTLVPAASSGGVEVQSLSLSFEATPDIDLSEEL